MDKKNEEQQNIPASENGLLEQCKKEAQEYLDRLKRAQADMANYKKDEQRRVGEMVKFGNERMLLDVIDMIGPLELAIEHAPPGAPQAWIDGVTQSVKQFEKFFERHGAEKIPTVGHPFDPAVHEAVAVQEAPEKSEEQIVLQEVRAGYRLHGKVIRPARVIISK